MDVKVNKVFVNSVGEEIYIVSIISKNDIIQNIHLTLNEYKDIVSALRSINIDEV